MSHRSFSILALPMIFSKKVFSIFVAIPIRRLTRSMSNLGKRDCEEWCGPPAAVVSMWLRSMLRAWSCRFSIWRVSFRPVVSGKEG